MKYVTTLTPDQIVLGKDGLRVGFFDKECKTDVKKNEYGEIISFKTIYKTYIHISIPNDPTTVVEREVKKRIFDSNDGEGFKYISEIDLYPTAYKKYLDLKNSIVEQDPNLIEIERLKKQLAEKELKSSEKTKEEKNSKNKE